MNIYEHIKLADFVNPLTGEVEQKMFLPVNAKTQWFYDTYPDGAIHTDIKFITPEACTFICKVYRNTADIPEDRYAADGYGTRYSSDPHYGGSYIATAATAAVSHALTRLGFGVPLDARFEDAVPATEDEIAEEGGLSGEETGYTHGSKSQPATAAKVAKKISEKLEKAARKEKTEEAEVPAPAEPETIPAGKEFVPAEAAPFEVAGSMAEPLPEAETGTMDLEAAREVVATVGAFSGTRMGSIAERGGGKAYLQWFVDKKPGTPEAEAAKILLDAMIMGAA